MTNKTKGVLLLASIPIQMFFWTGVFIEFGCVHEAYKVAASFSGLLTCMSTFIFAMCCFEGEG